MLLGDREDLPRADVDAFRRSGLAHLLAISGLHVCVLFGAFTLLVHSLLGRLPLTTRWQQVCLAAVLVLAGSTYGLMLGWPASAARALVMLLIATLVRLVGRVGRLSRTWMLALLATLTWRPEQIIHNLGAQLSFAAVGGLLAVPWLMRWPLPRILRPFWAGITAGTAAFLATAPLLMHTIGWVPVGSVLTGLIRIPLGSLFLVLAFSALLLPLGGNLLAWLTESTLQILLWWARVTALPWHPLLRADPAGWVIVLLMMVWMAWIAWPSLSRSVRILGLISSLMVYSLGPDPEEMTMTLLDIGQGESIVLEWMSGRPWAVDTGPGVAAGAILARYLAFRGQKSTRLLLSHGDQDHVGGMQRLVEQIDVANVYAPFQDVTVPDQPILSGHRWSPTEGIRLLVLHPGTPGRNNNHSLVMLLVMPGLRILLTGDIDAATESQIVARCKPLWNDSRLRVLKLAHHGSSTSTGPALLESYQPDMAFYSTGRDNAFGHPHPEVLERLASSQVTAHGTMGSGALQLRWNGSRLTTRRWQRGAWRTITAPSSL